MNKKDTACVVFYTDKRYDGLVDNVKNSFITFNGEECDYHQVDYTNQEKYNKELEYFEYAPETFIMQYVYAYEIMRKHNYKKVIILGSDTIVCGRLDEFLDDNTTPVLATLNYPCQESTERWITPIVEVTLENNQVVRDSLNINADVVCFNNHEALKKVIELSLEYYTHFSIQGGLNDLAWTDKSYEVKVVDAPYPLSKVSYNCRSKGVFGTDMIVKGKLAKHGALDGQPSPILNWYVKDNKLYTSDHKQIKVFHFVEGLGGRPDDKFYELLDDFKTTWFNKDTLDFFINDCKCLKFFN